MGKTVALILMQKSLWIRARQEKNMKFPVRQFCSVSYSSLIILLSYTVLRSGLLGFCLHHLELGLLATTRSEPETRP